MTTESESWPQVAPKPSPDDVVSVLMTETMARWFEERCLGEHTVGRSALSPPLHFGPDDLPTYIITLVGDQRDA